MKRVAPSLHEDMTHNVLKIAGKGGCIGIGAFCLLSAGAIALILSTYDPQKQPGMGPDSEESRARSMQISRSEIDKFIHKNAKTEDEIRREHPEESAAAIAHARAWFENTFKGGHTTSEEEAKETKRLAEEWRKKWDEQGVAHK